MVMIGNITLSGRPREDDLRTGVICMGCLEECNETGEDNSFSDHFGQVECWDVVSDCCGCSTGEGVIFLDKSSTHIARKDHVRNGKVIIPKGAKYRAYIKKGYVIDPDSGEHKGLYEYRKKLLEMPKQKFPLMVIKKS